ncbi:MULTISPECIES: hypothetical protein [Paraburkholderia]|uniref:hypothetical protein n=1 Tax=Paraburkholderia TaxID=1822464 RepID=UPI001EF89AC4|nr:MULTISPECIES: hypothetical protein [Paraburkholderia]MDH6153394.1 hypothetical protein [Paraburkholderia sp. WSM4179]
MMNKYFVSLAIVLSTMSTAYAQGTVIKGMDFGPLAKLVGTWRTIATGGVDVAPGQVGSKVGTGNPAMEPYYEQLTFEPAADATNASDQYRWQWPTRFRSSVKGTTNSSMTNAAI